MKGNIVTKMRFSEIKKFVLLVEQSEISELEIIQDGVTLRIKKELSGAPTAVASPIPQTVMTPASSIQPAPSAPLPTTASPPAEEKIALIEVKSPIVGTFYRASSPEAEPYVQVGDRVKPGQVLCIIEAMKLMNEIECETGGKIAEICGENGKPVEFGQVLFLIEPV